MKIEKFADAEEDIELLKDLLVDSVGSGASVGFLPPLSREEAMAYWKSLNTDIASGRRVLLVVRSEDVIAASVQVSFNLKKNGLHRAELEKLMVHQNFRRQGLGRLLLGAIEEVSLAAGRWLIVLDTRVGDSASHLYRSAGYTECGRIPEFALNADGAYDATCFFYKIIGSPH